MISVVDTSAGWRALRNSIECDSPSLQPCWETIVSFLRLPAETLEKTTTLQSRLLRIINMPLILTSKSNPYFNYVYTYTNTNILKITHAQTYHPSLYHPFLLVTITRVVCQLIIKEDSRPEFFPPNGDGFRNKLCWSAVKTILFYCNSVMVLLFS